MPDRECEQFSPPDSAATPDQARRQSKVQARKERLAAQLRENLKKRKQQAKARR